VGQETTAPGRTGVGLGQRIGERAERQHERQRRLQWEARRGERSLVVAGIVPGLADRRAALGDLAVTWRLSEKDESWLPNGLNG
jgi:hypothetical protein